MATLEQSLEHQRLKGLIPDFWVQNIEKLKQVILPGDVYFDLFEHPDRFSIKVSSVEFGSPSYSQNSVDLFVLYKPHNERNSTGRSIGSFVEAAAVAAVLTLCGYEVHYGNGTYRHSMPDLGFKTLDDGYTSFSEAIFDLSNQSKQNQQSYDADCAMFSGEKNGHRKPISLEDLD